MREDRQRRQARGHAVVVFTVADGAGFPPGAGHAACRDQAERMRAENQAAGGVVAADWVEGATVDWQEGG